jgi:hypothetical protein
VGKLRKGLLFQPQTKARDSPLQFRARCASIGNRPGEYGLRAAQRVERRTDYSIPAGANVRFALFYLPFPLFSVEPPAKRKLNMPDDSYRFGPRQICDVLFLLVLRAVLVRRSSFILMSCLTSYSSKSSSLPAL